MQETNEERDKRIARGLRLDVLFERVVAITNIPKERKKQALAILCALAGFLGVLSFWLLDKIF